MNNIITLLDTTDKAELQQDIQKVGDRFDERYEDLTQIKTDIASLQTKATSLQNEVTALRGTLSGGLEVIPMDENHEHHLIDKTFTVQSYGECDLHFKIYDATPDWARDEAETTTGWLMQLG